ncbi:MAG: hypothetical protein RI902_1211 [Pseudomonadota bacterium]|jgi:hypothetical protein
MSQNEVALSRELKEFIEIEFAKLKESVRESFDELILRNSKSKDTDVMK